MPSIETQNAFRAPPPSKPSPNLETLRSRLKSARKAGLWLREKWPAIGMKMDRGLRDAIENWSTRQGKFWIIAGASVDAESFSGIKVTSRCARIGNAELIEWLCAAGADPDETGIEKWTPAHHASSKGHARVLQALFRAGANFNARASSDGRGFTPLIVACRENRQDSIEQLSKLGARIDDPDDKGETPLLLCARRGFESLVVILLQAGARVDATEFRGFQAIHLAASQGHEGICRALLAAGADPEARGPWNKTPSNLALAEGHDYVASLMERMALQKPGSIPEAEASTPSSVKRL